MSFKVPQSSPMYPGSQKHFPTWHSPWPEHVKEASDEGQMSAPNSTVAQSKPPNPGSQTHMPLMHSPRSWHCGVPGQGSRFSQYSAENPGSQKHRPLKHTPWLLQSSWHFNATEQSSPLNPV
jgi:hypothetical protein